MKECTRKELTVKSAFPNKQTPAFYNMVVLNPEKLTENKWIIPWTLFCNYKKYGMNCGMKLRIHSQTSMVATVEVWEWIGKFIQHFSGFMIIYLCWDSS